MNLARASRLFLGTASLALGSPLSAQDTLSSVALRRIAEALDGTNNLRSAFVLACPDSAYKVAAVVATDTQAVVLRRSLPACYRTYGPYVAGIIDLNSNKAVRGCVHDGHSSNQEPNPIGPGISYVMRRGPATSVRPAAPPPTPAIYPICPSSPFQISEIASMTLVTRLRDGREHEMLMGPEVDAIFLSVPAIDKFMVPYYARVLGVDSAAAMRQRIVRSLSR